MKERTEEQLLDVSNLRIAYRARSGGEVSAVDGISFFIRRGETVGLLGESGCGKSTIALSLLGLLPRENTLQDGAILFNGRAIQNLREQEWQKIRGADIALIPQDPTLALSPVKRVGEQVADVVQAHRPWKRTRCREEAGQLLLSVHLKDVPRIFSSYPFQLSGGQLQRVVIAQALACSPSLVIADEPTSALDSIIRTEILALFQELKGRSGTAFVFISHEPEVLALLADRILVMKEGKIIEEGKFAELRGRPAAPFTRELMNAMRHSARPKSANEHSAKSPEAIRELTAGPEPRK
ncbi:MAG TPA: ABC transporter ATP-binding protein [Candidatus Acidoferrales bacterium]|nr:ABC transporter ATP-binding protein [Candidatus Acidoferrales bacterium]